MKNLSIKREPVMISTLTVIALETLILMLVSLNILPWNSEQIASVNNFLVAGVALAAAIVPALIARKRVTPVADPRLADGQKAVLMKKEYSD